MSAKNILQIPVASFSLRFISTEPSSYLIKQRKCGNEEPG